MLTIVKDAKQIKDLIDILKIKLSIVSKDLYEVIYRSQNNKEIPIDIFLTDKDLWWGSVKLDDENKYFNPFGLVIPKKGSYVIGDCELNFSDLDHTLGFSSQFGSDENGTIYLLHSGRFSGVSREKFNDYCRNKPVVKKEVEGKNNPEYYVIGSLEGNTISTDIFHFVDLVKKFKEENRGTKQV
ncbi:MAG: hypothetical protein JWQ34_2109 [Mucilaginibacter sp.]|uniref:hypothetical protein n=1 Tax=Mucilaginibacter sp. TaxID=1882438 RepID=UPI00261B01F9|nr:hypothetical protein [Mucilaginibacter sp.]MDB5003884.1 hypothetical protein [Mucilaginibacter sp.]